MISGERRRRVFDGVRPVSVEHTAEDEGVHLSQARTEFIEFFDGEFHGTLAFLVRSGASFHDAQDAVHNAFVEAWKLMVYQPEKWVGVRNRRGWIRTVALNKYRRPHGSGPQVVLEPRAELPEPVQPESELSAIAQDLLDALDRLDEPMRSVMALCQEDGVTAIQIAENLGLTQQKVLDLKKKARKILARQIAELRRQRGRWG